MMGNSKKTDYGEEYLELKFKPEDFRRVVRYFEYVNTLVGCDGGGTNMYLTLQNGNSVHVFAECEGRFEVVIFANRSGGGITRIHGDLDDDENSSELWLALKQFEGQIEEIVVEVYPSAETLYYSSIGHLRDGGVYFFLPKPDFSVEWKVMDDYEVET